MKKFSRSLAKQVEKLPGGKFSLSNDGVLKICSVSRVAKTATGYLYATEGGSLNFHLRESGYNKKYLKILLNSAFSNVATVNFIDYPKVGDVIWIYPLGGIPDLNLGDKLNVQHNLWYFRINGSSVACSEGIGTIGRNFEAELIGKPKDVCDGGSELTNFLEVRLNNVI